MRVTVVTQQTCETVIEILNMFKVHESAWELMSMHKNCWSNESESLKALSSTLTLI